MKKSTLIVCNAFITFSLTAFACGNTNDTEIKKTTETVICEPPAFFYDIDSRFIANITREDLRNAKTITDIVPKGATEGIEGFSDVKINILTEGENPYAKGEDHVLSVQQTTLLQSADYSTNFNIEAFCWHNNPANGKLEKYRFVYYITVIPEKEASYLGGKDVVINYLKKNSKSIIAKIDRGNLKSGKAHFTITKEGKIKNVNLESTSGYPTVDEKMIQLITTIPGVWVPATNEKGENVEQELVFSFGTMGC